MNNQPLNTRKRKKDAIRGSTLVIVMVLSLALGIFLVSIMGRGQVEQKITDRNIKLHEVNNAAEAIGNYGMAEIVKRYTTSVSLPEDEFSKRPLQIPATGLYDNSPIVMSYAELVGGKVPSSYRQYIDPDDRANANDPLIGSEVDSVDIKVYSRAGARPAIEPKRGVTAFLEQTLHVRYVNLTDALFYNMDLELHPGPTMVFYGKVHTNTDMYLCSMNSLTFYDSVTAAGRIIHGFKVDNGNQRDGHNGDVRFLTRDRKDTFSMRVNPSGRENTNTSWVYNRDGYDWVGEADRRWGPNVKDKDAGGVKARNPAGIPEYKPENFDTKDIKELENHAYAVIEPLLPLSNTNRKKDITRHQKFNARSCLVFEVKIVPSTHPRYDANTGGIAIDAYTWERNDPDLPINSQFPFDKNMKIDPATKDPIKLPVYLPPGLIGSMHKDGKPITRTVKVWNSDTGSAQTMPIRTYIEDGGDGKPEVYSKSGKQVIRGMTDQRQTIDGNPVNLSPITIDIQRLRELIDVRAHPNTVTAEKMKDFWTDPDTGTVTFDPQHQWNGVIYVQFPIQATAPRPADKIVPANILALGTKKLNLSLQVIRGHTIPNVPTKYDATVDSSHRYAMVNQGFTISTNGPVYAIGNYNSDGKKDTGAPNKPDDWVDARGDTYYEPPAGVACDAYTVLSKEWLPGAQDMNDDTKKDRDGDTNSPYSPSFSNNRIYSNGRKEDRNAKFTEQSVAVITGLVPTQPGTNTTSGGAHNFPRFLEHWGDSVYLRLRTSLNALFESEIQTSGMPDKNGTFYQPPYRDWGRPDSITYKDLEFIPPGWIQVIDFRLGGIRPLSKDAYEDLVAPLRPTAIP